MDIKYIISFLSSMGEPEMASEVLSMYNRLEAFSIGLDLECRAIAEINIQKLASEGMRLCCSTLISQLLIPEDIKTQIQYELLSLKVT